MPALLGLLRGVLLLGLHLSDLQPRRLFVLVMLGHVRELHMRRLHMPHLRTRSVTWRPTTPHSH